VWNINSSLVNELQQKAYRVAYVVSQIRIGIPFQIRSLRLQRGWNKEEFAKRVGMAQPRVSEMERPGARRLNIETLLRIAEAFDVALQVRFVPFRELVEWSESFDPDTFSVPSFDDEILESRKAYEAIQNISSTGDKVEHQQWFDMQQSFLLHERAFDLSLTISGGRSTFGSGIRVTNTVSNTQEATKTTSNIGFIGDSHAVQQKAAN
jgi:transcriptional regulator with XRE-family HTH domain